jgi:hypothetical protein
VEQVSVYRPAESYDEDGNPVRGALALVDSFPALVAPAMVPTSTGTDGESVIFDHTIYIRGQEPTGILDTDVIEVRGKRTPVQGVVGVWLDTAGNHIGDVVNVSLKEA